jgi:hypothetical protein
VNAELFRELFVATLIVVIPVLLVVAAVRADTRSRRGYGIALLAPAPVVSTIAFEIYLRAQPPNHGPGLGPAQLVVIYFVCACYYTLVLSIGALVEAGRARQWSWVAGLIAAAVAPTLLLWAEVALAASTRRPPLLPGFGDLWLIVLPPALVALLYGIYRTARPGDPVSLTTPIGAE